ncbi:hypothetical protein V8G58_01165 [Gaetbulibacter aestuarii]|uniref:Uncharacterized protein n=2 Tax=Gaetbulibacter aestuarii TaxID=1502358 RepID=A0ABW7MV47_9FLAO
MEGIQGGTPCTHSEMVSAGATMLILGALSFGTLAIAYGMVVGGACIMKGM